MSEIDRIAAELRAGLEGVTSGPWGLAFNGTGKLRIIRRAENDADDEDIAEFERDEDAEFLKLCSSENIRLLLDELSRRSEVIERAMEALTEALVAMKLAAALPGVSDEYDFEPAIATVTAARALLQGESNG